MKISTKGKYGLKAIVDIAVNMENEKCVSIREIAERQGLSENYLEQIISSLRKARIVGSIRGAGGGYFLAKSSEQITVGEVLRVLEGALAPVECVTDPSSCGDADCDSCTTKGVWMALYERINEVVDSISIADLARDVRSERLTALLDKP